MWSRFTNRAQEVVFIAQAEAQLLQGEEVDAEHLALALLRSESVMRSALFAALTAPEETVRQAIFARLPATNAAPGQEMRLGESGKQAIDGAYTEARTLKENFIGLEHLLLGVLSTTSAASEILNDFGLTLAGTREAVRNLPADVRKADRSRTLHKTLALFCAALLRRKKRG